MVDDAVNERDDTYTAVVLRRLLRQALEDDPELRTELAALLPAPTEVTITASGERSIAAQNIGTAITGDGHTPPRP
ncbi:hypothetical protein ACFWOB_34835 [Streptomyces sp. NPDC058420]|uniref:hypothetical protein n=1 Tax=Streptomyces sp. NPDC058420 TaxID=3346489 RepID=UPI00364C6ECE